MTASGADAAAPWPAPALVLAELLPRAWTAASSAVPSSWRPAEPSLGQCAATALVVQDVLGGGLRVGRLHERGQPVTHCWNALPCGRIVDFTSRQLGGRVPAVVRPLPRDALLAAPGVAMRYAILSARVAGLVHLGRRRSPTPRPSSGRVTRRPRPAG